MIKFGSEKMKRVMTSLGIGEDQAISNKMISKQIESAQKRVEGYNYDMRKNLLDYDNVVSKQREIIYDKRNAVLDQESISDKVLTTFKEYVSHEVESHLPPENELTNNDLDNICEHFNSNILKIKKISVNGLKDKTTEEVIDTIYNIVIEDYNNKLKEVPEEIKDAFEKNIALSIIDKNWRTQLDAMEALQEGVRLRGMASTNPLQAYALEGFEMFDNMLANINAEISLYLLNAEIRRNIVSKEEKNIRTNDGKEKAKNTPKRVKKIGRNELCPCGSGKKYKQCCGK